jgi:hypothetical protein
MSTSIQSVVDDEIRAAANDIDEYLSSDAPLECYREDIDKKLEELRANVAGLIPSFISHSDLP